MATKSKNLVRSDVINRQVTFTGNKRRAKHLLKALTRSVDNPKVSQAIQHVRNQVYLNARGYRSEDTGRIVANCGVVGGEGVTTVTLLLMMSLAELKHSRILYIDGAFDREKFVTVKELFSLKKVPTMSSNGYFLQCYTAKNPGLCFMTSEVSLSPIKFFSDGEFESFVEELKGSFDYILFDMPPLLNSSETRLFVPYADVLYMTCIPGKTLVSDLERCKALATECGRAFDGAVLNRQRLPIWARLWGRDFFV